MAQPELDRFGDHRIRIDVLLTVDVSVPAYHAGMVRDNQPASVELARVELHVTTDVVAVHGLLGGGRCGHIGVLVVLRRAPDGVNRTTVRRWLWRATGLIPVLEDLKSRKNSARRNKEYKTYL